MKRENLIAEIMHALRGMGEKELVKVIYYTYELWAREKD